MTPAKLTRLLSVASLISLITGCAISTPFRWPGFDSAKGITAYGAREKVVVVVTNARLHQDKREAFDRYTQIVFDQMAGTPGLVGYSIRREILGDQVWTATVWTSEDAMRQFVYSPSHLAAMQAGDAALRESRFTRLSIPARNLPLTWDALFARIAAGEGVTR